MIHIANWSPLFDKKTRVSKVDASPSNLMRDYAYIVPGSTVAFPDEETICHQARTQFRLLFVPCIIDGVKFWTTLSSFVKPEELENPRATIKRLAGATIEVPEDVEEACKNGMSIFYFNRMTRAVSHQSLIEGKDDILHYIWIFYPSLLDWADTWILKLRELHEKRCNV